ncbi:CAF17-like 4Fe-4S cluster assembly/insertion protein YgfZ [Halocatena pleomorpha]|uniref:Aminomethyl transferase family protein n=1 Tax=Halocatena pleomorpha TaxID=1785090 RepID=A0A3P3R620_9EURY|nr:aminomethyltransferase family protein [Halocatena pleomorpha]RRJ28931.1 aminomethyl transferase family protein [Halocatena pleomorpha]
MTVLESVHADHGATFTEHNGARVVAGYGRPDRSHRAVRNVVGVIERGYGIIEITGADRISYVDNVISNSVPRDDGVGCYALVLDPQGAIETELYVYNANDRLLLFLPFDRAQPLVEEWQSKVFIDDVEIRLAADLVVFGVHGPKATEKVASVLTGPSVPERPLSFVRGTMGDIGVTVIAGDGLTGEEGYEIICEAADAERAFDTLVNHGLNAAPFGYTTWNTLTLEAGTPLFGTELAGVIPNVAGVHAAIDSEKGCYVGQEVVARVENHGQPSRRLVGLAPEGVPPSGASVRAGDTVVGEVTRAAQSPLRDDPIALAYIDFTVDTTELTVDTPADCAASVVELPFVTGSSRSLRLPDYERASR